MSANKSMLAAALMAIGLAICVPAHADTYNFSYSDGINSASGTLTTTGSAVGLNGLGLSITGITGTFDNYDISGLLASGTCCAPPNNNNILYLSGTYLDLAGVGFSDSNGDSVNIFYWDSHSSYAVIVNNGDVQGGGTFTVAPVPLPGALPLFATGLGALGLLGWRSKKKARAA